MPKGKPAPQTVATAKYKKKVGIKQKNFDLPEEMIADWADACKKTGVAQTAKIRELIQGFIDEVNETK